jgi:hypothetical protein
MLDACADGVEDFLVIARQCLWVVVVSSMMTSCLGSFSDHIPIDPATVADLRRQVPVYSESDVHPCAYVLLQPLSATACQHTFWDPAPTPEDATDQ